MEDNVIGILNKNLGDFKKSIKIVDTGTGQSVRFGGSADDNGGYYHNQKEVVDLTDLYYNSKYRDGKKDQDGQRKLFMNMVRFYANVGEKQTDIDVSNYTFIPDSEEWSNLVWFLKRQFTVWARENDYGIVLNELNKDYSKYGTCVIRRFKDSVERVPLQNIQNTQDATSLKDAPIDGGYTIIEHDMTVEQMKKFPDWDTEGIDFEGTKKVYEQYYMYEQSVFDGGDTDEDKDKELGVAFIMPEKSEANTNNEKSDGFVLFTERVDEVPFEEAHWDRQDGRWLGIGEVEKQFENQVAINMTENLRRKHLIWGAKKVWQTQGNAVVKNLTKQVSDGQVLEVGANGKLDEVPMASQNLAEFRDSKASWEENSKNNAFAFEVSTGESMPSGTPFRLGVILANSAARYYELKREKFGLFLYQSFFSHLIPIFKEQTKEHKVAVANGEEGTEFLLEAITNYNVNRRFNAQLLKGEDPDMNIIKTEVEQDLSAKPFMFANVPAKAYDDAKFYMNLDITGEARDTDADMATLTTLYTSLSQQQDPRADKILDKILMLTGNNPNKLLGNTKAVAQQLQGQAQGGGLAGATPDLTSLNAQPENGIA